MAQAETIIEVQKRVSEMERTQALKTLHSERFVDASPYTVYVTLLDEGIYLCSVSTLYRLLADLGVTKTHSRPYLSNDKPFSESHFKTLKLRPDFPKQFGSVEDARTHCLAFSPRYNTEHRHAGIALLMPEDVHYGRTAKVLETRQQVLDAVFAANPNCFKGRAPRPQQPPEAVWINPPAPAEPEDFVAGEQP